MRTIVGLSIIYSSASSPRPSVNYTYVSPHSNGDPGAPTNPRYSSAGCLWGYGSMNIGRVTSVPFTCAFAPFIWQAPRKPTPRISCSLFSTYVPSIKAAPLSGCGRKIRFSYFMLLICILSFRRQPAAACLYTSQLRERHFLQQSHFLSSPKTQSIGPL